MTSRYYTTNSPRRTSQYSAQESTESQQWRVPYQETEVYVEPRVSSSYPSTQTYSQPLSRTSSHRTQYRPEYASRTSNAFQSYETEERNVSHNMTLDHTTSAESENVEAVADGFNEASCFLGFGFGGVTHYENSTPSSRSESEVKSADGNQGRGAYESLYHHRYNTESQVSKPYEAEYEKISMEHYNDFYPANSQDGMPRNESEEQQRPGTLNHALSDPGPISVEHERLTTSSLFDRESHFPEVVNLGGSDPFYYPPARSYSSYRRHVKCDPPRPDINGLPSLENILPRPQHSSSHTPSFETSRSYNPAYNNSSLSLASTYIAQPSHDSSDYSSERPVRSPSVYRGSLCPDNDRVSPARVYNNSHNLSNISLASSIQSRNGCGPPVHYSAHKRRTGMAADREDKIGYVVCEMNRRDEMYTQLMQEQQREKERLRY